MNDAELVGHWDALEPSARRRRRIEARLAEWLDAHDTSLAAEWLDLVKAYPFAGLSLATVGGLALWILSPLGWLAMLLL